MFLEGSRGSCYLEEVVGRLLFPLLPKSLARNEALCTLHGKLLETFCEMETCH